MAAKATWTEEHLSILRQLYPNHTCREIAAIVGHTPYSVEWKAKKLRLKKDKAWQYARKVAGGFKKGVRPFNYMPIGTVFKNSHGYLTRKIGDPRVYKFLHHEVWEQHHGPVPEGHMITFIDGNRENITIGNLRCETNEERFYRCCCMHTAMPPELRHMVILKGQLSRQIKKIEKK
jgi:hypothetical protein